MNSDKLLGTLGIFVGVGTTGLNTLYPATASWMLWVGWAVTALLVVWWAIARKTAVKIKMTDCGAADCNTAIKLAGDAKLDSKRFTSFGNKRFLEMNDRAEAKLRDTYHEGQNASSDSNNDSNPRDTTRKSSGKGWSPGYKLPWTK